MSEYFAATGVPAEGAGLQSAEIRAEFLAFQTGSDKFPILAGNGGKVVAVNAGGTALEASATPALGTPASGVTDNLTTTTTAAAIADTDFVDTNLAAGGKRKILWTAVKTYLNSSFVTLSQLFVSGGAALIGNAPSGSISSTTVQAAINELNSEKAALAGSSSQAFATSTLSATGNITISGAYGLRGSFGPGTVATNLSLGDYSLAANTTGNRNVAVGQYTLATNITGYENTAVGLQANYSGTGCYQNVAVGDQALYYNTGHGNTAIGKHALYNNSGGYENVAIGNFALFTVTTNYRNVAVGYYALNLNSADGCTAVGASALSANSSGANNSAFGCNALSTNTTYSNCSGLGQYAQITGSNQVQLGDSATTTYAYGTVQNRSDLRDKADVRDTTLGLDFIMALRPVDYRLDMRDDYRPAPPDAQMPHKPTDETSETYPEDLAAYDLKKAAYDEAQTIWIKSTKHENIVRDGSKKRSRYHHGLIAQEVKAVIDHSGVDFGGYQDHKIAGGEDVLSIGYDEFVAPLIRAVQELKAELDALKAKPI